MTTTTGRFSGLDTTTWSGIRTSKCPLCCEIFSGESTFVLHRVEGKVNGPPGIYRLGPCRHPADKNMTLNERGVWGLPRGGSLTSQEGESYDSGQGKGPVAVDGT